MECRKSVVILIILTVFLFGIAGAWAGGQDSGLNANETSKDSVKTFAQLEADINESEGQFELNCDYAFDGKNDSGPVLIEKGNFTISGNNHILDGNGQSAIFVITANNVTISNLVFKNGNSDRGGAIYSSGAITLINVTFINNAAEWGGGIYADQSEVSCFSCKFIENSAENGGGGIYATPNEANFMNCEFTNNTAGNGGGIYGYESEINCMNCKFTNNTSESGGGILGYENEVSCMRCEFTNNTAGSGGGIMGFDSEVSCMRCEFANNTAETGPGICSVQAKLNCSDSRFLYNGAANAKGCIFGYYSEINSWNCRFIDNNAEEGSAIYLNNGLLSIENASITTRHQGKHGSISVDTGNTIINNCTFENITAEYAPAFYFMGWEVSNVTINNTRFTNLKANKTAGAVSLKNFDWAIVENCTFINTTSAKNAGAIFADVISEGGYNHLRITNTRFENASSGFGGALLRLEGDLLMDNTDFINCSARFNGGAAYISFTDCKINDCTFNSNGADIIEGYPTYGGALYLNYCNVNLTGCAFTANSAFLGNAVYALDSEYNITNTSFADNRNAIYTDFDYEGHLGDDNTYGNDTVLINNTIYNTTVDTPAMELTLHRNTIDVSALPSRYDLRDWGWVSDVKDQGKKGYCWTFSMTGAMESALLKDCEIKTDLSQNNMGNMMLKYSPYGFVYLWEGGHNSISSDYLLSWLGAFSQDYDSYDELGKISPAILINESIHVQDVILVRNSGEDNGSQLKSAILKYGSLATTVFFSEDTDPYYNPQTAARYVNESLTPNHGVSVIGWDDHYSKDNFQITPPGDGAWIIKNSAGTEWGDNGFGYVSYYDKTFATSNSISNCAYGIILENTVAYNKNYQHDTVWTQGFIYDDNISYANIFQALGDDLIAGVGTYFTDENVSFTIEIYVNDELKITQEGISQYYGYHTVKLESYIPIKAGDKFCAMITSSSVPFTSIYYVRTHHAPGMSMISRNGTWSDLYDEGGSAILRVYTVADDTRIIGNNDISVDYSGGKCFSVKVVTADGHAVGAGAVVSFEINGKTAEVKTDCNGIAKIRIGDVAGKYVMKTRYNGKVYANTVTVKHVLTASKVTVKKTASKFTLKAKLKINGKLVKGKIIKFKFNGKTYKVKTNSKGIAQKTFKKSVIKKLKKGKTYAVKVSYLKDTIKTTVKVK